MYMYMYTVYMYLAAYILYYFILENCKQVFLNSFFQFVSEALKIFHLLVSFFIR